MKTIFISACELSADRHASFLVETIKRRYPEVRILGIGSDACREAGMDVLLDLSAYSTVGIVEHLRYVPKLLSAFKDVKRFFLEHKPDLFIPIDNQGFHMRCCKLAKQLGIPVYYFIAPQEWHWGSKKGGEAVAECVDKVLAIFPPEQQFYEDCGVDSVFVGHPSVHYVSPYYSKVAEKRSVFAIFPGSRLQEIERCLPVFLEAAALFCERTGLTPVVSVSSSQYEHVICSIVQKSKVKRVELFSGASVELISRSSLSLVTSGTITLEHALMGVPYVAGYKFHPVTYWVARTFFKKTLEKIPFMTMPNILLNEGVYPELLQEQVTVDVLISTLHMLHEDSSFSLKATGQLRALLGGESIFEKIVDEVSV